MKFLRGEVSKPEIRVQRWRGGSHPTHQAISTQMQKEGITPYMWTQGPNFRFPLRSQGYDKVLYVVEGTLEVILPDSDQRIVLRPGDRLELPRAARHAAIVGRAGVKCIEGERRTPLS
jgi:mannose-6-phosphate isomerase-like protein (cupin superfamily)